MSCPEVPLGTCSSLCPTSPDVQLRHSSCPEVRLGIPKLTSGHFLSGPEVGLGIPKLISGHEISFAN